MSYEIRRGHDDLRLEISARRPLLEVAIANAVHRVAELSDADGRFTIDVDGRVFSGWRLITSDRIEIRLDGRSFVFDRREGVARSDAMAGSGDEVRAEMPGTLVARHVDVGAQVPHSALRFYVMGERGALHDARPSSEEIERMGQLLEASLNAGALAPEESAARVIAALEARGRI